MWEKLVDPNLFEVVNSLDDATLERLHRYTEYSGMYATEKFVTSDADTKRVWKRLDLEKVLRRGRHGREEIARVLFSGNTKAQNLQEDYVTQVVDKAARDYDVFAEARLDWIKTSMSVSPEQLTPNGKPPPLAVRLEKALPFRR